MTNNNCVYCEKKFTHKKTLYFHMRNVHNIQPKTQKRGKLMCSFCSNIEVSYHNLRDHLISQHNVDLYKEEKLFENKEDFIVWKQNKEKEMKCFYVKQCGTVINKNKKSYYVCHRSGSCTSQGKHVNPTQKNRTTKAQGSAKLPFTCPSTMEVTEENQEENLCIKVVLFMPHVGHENTLKYLNLSKCERAQIAGKIAEGVSFERILDDIRNNINSVDSLERIHLLDRQDLRNIKREFLLDSQQYHENDVVSVNIFVKHMAALGEDNPVLYYKQQGASDSYFEEIDFFLAIMTSFQKSLLSKFGSKTICIDSTHGTTGYDFYLTTVLVIDEFGEGVPAAFLLSSRVNSVTLTYFFQLIKNSVGVVQTNVFMTDDASEFFNAWCQVMPSPNHRLLCAWHVDRNWRAQLIEKVEGNQEEKACVYKHLRLLMEERDECQFKNLVLGVLNMLLYSDKTKSFGEYFNRHYVKRPQLWAYCYRKGLGINTNMYLESMHKQLKHIYLEGKKCKRVDKCLNALLKLTRDHMFKRFKKIVKGKSSFRINLIKSSHIKSDIIKITDISIMDENCCWQVKSCTSKDKYYTVEKITNSCSSECQLICRPCGICVHMYSCTCLDNFVKGNICKHIHAICCKVNTPVTVSSKSSIKNELNEQENLFTFASTHGDVLQKSNRNDIIKSKLDLLYNYVSKNVYDDRTILALEKTLNSALKIAQQSDDIVTGQMTLSSEPSNKNVDKQLRFKSNKKTPRNEKVCLKKPTSTETEEMHDSIQQKVRVVNNINNEHSYSLEN